MIKKKLYKYLGRNGILITYILLDGISRIDMFRLEASPGMILTDGEREVYCVDIEAEELDNWREIEDLNKDNLNK